MNEKENRILEKLRIWIQEHREEYLRDLKEFVQIRSVQEAPEPGHPFGPGPAKALDLALEFGRRYYLETENDDYYTMSYLLKGQEERELAIMGHADVVHEGEGWHYPPYEGILEGNYFIGRGSSDNKGAALAALYTLRAIRDLQIPFRHSLRVIFGANEEGGMEDARHFVKTHTLPELTLVCDNVFPLCYGEKGILRTELVTQLQDERLVDIWGGVAANAVPSVAYAVIKEKYEKIQELFREEQVKVIPLEKDLVKIQAAGIAGHAAFPEKSKSAIVNLARALVHAGFLLPEDQEKFSFLASAFADTRGEGLGIQETDDLGTYTTHIGSMIRFEEHSLIQTVDIRYAIHGDGEKIAKQVRAAALEHGFQAAHLEIDPPRYDSLEDPKVQLLLQAVKDVSGVEEPPILIGGATHARKIPNAIPYGPYYMRTTPGNHYGAAHGADEAVYLPYIFEAMEVYVIALMRADQL